MRVGVLGPVEAYLDGQGVDLGTPKQRALLAALALSRGRPVPVDTIIDLLWGHEPPAGVTATLQAYVSGLRRALEPGRERRAPAAVLVTVAPGYALRVADDAVDASLFESTIARQHRRLSGLAEAPLPRADLIDALGELDHVLALWRGTPYVELEDAPAAVAERARLEELRLVALEDRAVAELALGRHATVVADLEALTSAYPLRERLWALRALALTRSGRQADALDVLRQVRELLADELGLEPSAELRDLQAAVLRQDASLAWVAPPDDEVPEPGPTAAPGPDVAWPMVGRDDEFTALVDALAKCTSGSTAFAVVTGEPGIGKTRITEELARYAASTGAVVLTGKGSQDDGAPPLWPWSTVLEGLGETLPTLEGGDEGSQFRAWEQITRLVRKSARDRTTLVVLDDLHWADSASLRVLRLLAETARDERMLVVATWRVHPEPTGALADVSEALARRHAVRLTLEGLEPHDVATVFETVAETSPNVDQALAIRDRTDGNPFFLVEYARLAGARGGLELLLGDDPPAAVQEVVSHRFARLPDATVDLLRLAAVVGRSFDSRTLARAGGIDEDDLLDLVEPAQAAGLVREDGIDRFSFAHALVRDSLLSTTSATRRARAHRRVAEALVGTTGREHELALHWRSAGPAYAAQAWRACREAAAEARNVHAHEQSIELLRAGLESVALDETAGLRDRYDLLMDLADAYRWAVMWPQLVATIGEAVDLAEQLGEPELAARTAVGISQGALWQTTRHGETNPAIIAALRRSLDRLDPADSPLRCHAMLALALEIYYASAVQERRALVDEALAMARRIGDERLLLVSSVLAFQALWTPRTAQERLDLATQALQLATDLGDEPTRVVAGTLRAVVLGELGRPAQMWAQRETTVAEAERLRMPYSLLVLETLVVPWHAMAGRFDECERLLVRVQTIDARVSLPHSNDAVMSALASLAMWNGQSGFAADLIIGGLSGGPFPLTGTVVSLLARAGRLAEAKEHYATHSINLEHEDWFSLHAWCMVAESALVAGDAAMAAAVYERLAPFAGMNACAGSGTATGPVESYLALSAAAAGEPDIAARHAAAALEQIQEWQIPLVAQWLGDLRDRYSF